MSWLTDPEIWAALLTLTFMEVVLGFDNIIFISILTEKLPPEQRTSGRMTGLGLAVFTRIALLLSIVWIMRLTTPLFSVLNRPFSGRDLILLGGGLFLLAKSTLEIHDKLETSDGALSASSRGASFVGVVLQIMVLDIVFSLDSVITAVGMTTEVVVMIVAIVLGVLVMIAAVNAISRFIERHPTVKMLALSFLLLIGVTLIGEALAFHIPKGYIYFAMAFSVFVEMLNIQLRQRQAAASDEPIR